MIQIKFNLMTCLQFWSEKTENSVRQQFNYDLYIKILKAKLNEAPSK
jgi:hypothetical protein